MTIRLCASLLALAAFATPTLAGTVILENGEVVIGKIKMEDANEEQVRVTWPYKEYPAPQSEGKTRGEMIFPMHRVRWVDVEADGPTEAYWKEHWDKEIGDDWKGEKRRWKLRQDGIEDTEGELPTSQTSEDSAALITEEPAESPAATPAASEAPAETPAEAAPAASPAADEGSGFCSLNPSGSSSNGILLGLLGLTLLGLRRRA